MKLIPSRYIRPVATLVALQFLACVLPLHLLAQAPAVPAAASTNAPPTEGAGYFFVQISDPQFGFFTGNPRMFEQETMNFEFVIASINRLKPAFVVICGDLVHNDGDAGQVAEFKRIIGKLDPSIPHYSASGNHDLGTTPTHEKLVFFRENIGKDWYSFRHADLYGIVLNSTIMMDPSLVPDEAEAQQNWLKQELVKAKASGARSIMVFQHHPFFIDNVNETNPNSVPEPRRTAYLDLFKDAGVQYIFAGHLHRNALATNGSLIMITTSAVGRPLGTDPSGLRIVTVRPSGVDYTYYGLGSVPTQVSLAARGRGRGAAAGGGGRGGAAPRGVGGVAPGVTPTSPAPAPAAGTQP